MTKTLIRAAGLAVAISLASLVVTASAGATLDLRFQLTSHRPDTPTGAVLHLIYPDDGPGGKPKPVQTGIYEFPAGTKFDEGAVPVCSASDAELQAIGPNACPSNTDLGGGSLLVDSGFGPPFDPFGLEDSYFHGPGQLITVFKPQGAPGPTMQVNRLEIQGSTIVDKPSLPPGYPPGTKTVAKQVDQEIALRGQDGRSFMTTPTTCPRSGEWVARLTIVYEDGSTDVATSGTPCKTGHHHKAKHRRRHHKAKHHGSRTDELPAA